MFGSCPTATNKPSASISVSCSGDDVAEPDARDVAGPLAEHLVDRRVQDELDLLVLPRAVDHDRRGAELVAAVDDHDLAREPGEEGRLLHRGVPAAHDDDDLVAEEGAVARRAVGDAAALERSLGGQPELACAGAGRDDHRIRAVLVVADVDAEGALGEVDARHVVGDELGPEALGLPAEVGHHRRADDAVGVAGVVLDVARDHQLAAPVEALDDKRAQVGAGGVEGGGVAGRAAADDDHVTYVAHEVSSGQRLAPPPGRYPIQRIDGRRCSRLRQRRRRPRDSDHEPVVRSQLGAWSGTVWVERGSSSGGSIRERRLLERERWTSTWRSSDPTVSL